MITLEQVGVCWSLFPESRVVRYTLAVKVCMFFG